MKKPELNDTIYVPTSLHVYRGADDFIGGKATINKIEESDHLPEDHVNYLMIGIKERPGSMYNYIILLEKQEYLKGQFGDNFAYPDPDEREEFNPPPNEGWK